MLIYVCNFKCWVQLIHIDNCEKPSFAADMGRGLQDLPISLINMIFVRKLKGVILLNSTGSLTSGEVTLCIQTALFTSGLLKSWPPVLPLSLNSRSTGRPLRLQAPGNGNLIQGTSGLPGLNW
jgi:hypothetical protein